MARVVAVELDDEVATDFFFQGNSSNQREAVVTIHERISEVSEQRVAGGKHRYRGTLSVDKITLLLRKVFEPVVAAVPIVERPSGEMDADGPRSRYPVASLQKVAAFDWAVESAARFAGDPCRVALGGASAGENLAAGAAVRLRDRGGAVPSLLALAYPVLHDPLPHANAGSEEALVGLSPADTFPPGASAALNKNYLGDAPAEVYAFPGGHDMTGLVPTLIVTADRDPLRASGEAFASELALASVDVSLVRQRHVQHGFLDEIGNESATRTIELIARRLSSRLRCGRDAAQLTGASPFTTDQ